MAQRIYDSLRHAFPEDRYDSSIENTAEVVAYLAERNFEVALIFLQISAEAAAAAVAGGNIRLRWSSFEAPYKAFLTLSRQVANYIKAKIPGKPEGGNKEAKVLDQIYIYLRHNESIEILHKEQLQGAFVSHGLVHFLSDYWLCLKDSNQANQDKRRSTMTAKLDVWSMKQLIVLIARFAGFNSVNLAFTEEAEFVTLWDVNQFGDGVWSFWNSEAEDGLFPWTNEAARNNQFYEVERKIRVSAGFNLISGAPQLIAHCACQILQKHRTNTAMKASFQSYRTLEMDPKKLPLNVKNLVAHLLVKLKAGKFLISQPLALSVLGTLQSLRGDVEAEASLTEAIASSQKNFHDFFTVPYSFLAEYYSRLADVRSYCNGHPLEESQLGRMALVPRLMVAKTASQYEYCPIRDTHLMSELDYLVMKLANEVVDGRMYPEDLLKNQPLVVALILAFLDHYFLWQSKYIIAPGGKTQTGSYEFSACDLEIRRLLPSVCGAPCRHLVFHDSRSPALKLENADPDITVVTEFCRDPNTTDAIRREARRWFHDQQGLSLEALANDGKVHVMLRSRKLIVMKDHLITGSFPVQVIDLILQG